MKRRDIALLTRRGLFGALLAPPLVILLAACGQQSTSETAPVAQTSTSPAAASPTTAPAAIVPTATTPLQSAATSTPPPVQPTPTTAARAQPAAVATLAPTPACEDDDDVTPAQTEGPYFTPNSPERASLLESGIGGTKIVLAGRVLSTSCQPVAGALLDFWQADDRGVYDNTGFKLRGHQFADQAGRYSLETIVPGLYPGRTRHFHVKAQAPNKPVLTTQLYFPGEASNQTDRIFSGDLVVAIQDTADGKSGEFDFVLDV